MNKKVLLVDFEGNNFNSLKDNLEERKFAVIHVNDGLNALEKFVKENPDLVILHSELPQVHAFYFCRKVRDEFKRETPIIIISENYSKQVEEEAIDKFKISCFFSPSHREEEIISKIMPILNGNKPSSEKKSFQYDNLHHQSEEQIELSPVDVIEIVVNGKGEKVNSQDLFGDIIEELLSS